VSAVDTTPELLVVDATAWKRWLARNHAKSDGVLLVLAKKGASSGRSGTSPSRSASSPKE
jgi:hypothetical protein